MYEERVKQGKSAVVCGAFIVVAVLVAAALPDMLEIRYRSLIHIGILAIAAYAVYWFMKSYIAEYIYAVTEDEFIIRQKIGSRETPLLDISIDSIEAVYAEMSPETEYSELKASEKMGFPFGRQKYFMVYNEGGVRRKLMFEPSEKLFAMLRDKTYKK